MLEDEYIVYLCMY